MHEKILKILKKYTQTINDPNIFFQPDIPEKKMKNAIEAYASSVEKEDILVLIDNTVFGKADEGLLITKEMLYTRLAFENKIKIELSQIKNVSLVEGALSCTLHINGNKVVTIHTPSKSAMNLIAEMLGEISEVCRAQSETNAQPQPSSIQDSLIKLKSIFEIGLISKEEYDEKRKEYIAQL